MYKNRLAFWLGIVVVVSGLYFVFIAYFDLGKNMLLLFSPKYSNVNDISTAGWDLLNALTAIMGAVMAGWGITIIFLSEDFNKRTQKFLLVALIVWYLLDSIGSIINNFQYNTILNTVFLIFGLLAIFWPNIRKVSLE